MKPLPADRLLLRPEAAVAAHTNTVFVEAVPWRIEAEDAASVMTVPGSHRAGVRAIFAGSPASGAGHLPLPNAHALRQRASRWRAGREHIPIVIFSQDRRDLASVTRAWFMLSWAGIGGVRVMLGGLKAWEAAGGGLGEAALPESKVIDATATPLHDQVEPAWPVRAISASVLAETAARGTVLDARPADHYAGFVNDPRSGHVPGAVSAPASELLDSDGALLSAFELRRWLHDRGAIGSQRVAAYCHGGVASSSLVFAGALLGQPIELYVDSWSAWAQDYKRPVEHGVHRVAAADDDFTCFDPR